MCNCESIARFAILQRPPGIVGLRMSLWGVRGVSRSEVGWGGVRWDRFWGRVGCGGRGKGRGGYREGVKVGAAACSAVGSVIWNEGER